MPRQQRLLFAPVGRKKGPGESRQENTIKKTIMEDIKEKKKMAGRPAKAVKKEVRACIRFTRSEYFIVKEKATQAGLKPAAYMRETAIHATVKPRLTDEDRVIVRRLIGMDNNFNQVAKCCHQEGVLRAMAYFEQFKIVFDEILKWFKS